MNSYLNITENVGWRVGAFLKSYNNIADPLPTSLYTNPKPITGLVKISHGRHGLLNCVKMGGVIVVLKFFVTLQCKSVSL